MIVKVKICGLTNLEDAQAAVDMGADLLGFNFYKGSPRYIEPAKAAEIINKIGAMIGGITYGAKASEADKHIKEALKLTPASPIAHIEHGNVLLLLDEKRNEDAAAAAYEKAAGCKPLDAMEALDAAFAKEQLE